MKLYIMRHGETDANKARVLQGRRNTPLNNTGREQAKEAGNILKDIEFHAIYVSPLKRTIETAELALSKSKNEFNIEDRIIEISFGEMEGQPFTKLNDRFKKFIFEPEDYCAAQGAESFESLMKRIGHFIEELKEVYADEDILIVSHGAAIRAMILYLKNLPIKDFWKTEVKNCAIIEVEVP